MMSCWVMMGILGLGVLVVATFVCLMKALVVNMESVLESTPERRRDQRHTNR